jgi:hypothetical protein
MNWKWHEKERSAKKNWKTWVAFLSGTEGSMIGIKTQKQKYHNLFRAIEK